MVMYVKWTSLGRTRQVPYSLCPKLLLRSSLSPSVQIVYLSVHLSLCLSVIHLARLVAGHKQIVKVYAVRGYVLCDGFK